MNKKFINSGTVVKKISMDIKLFSSASTIKPRQKQQEIEQDDFGVEISQVVSFKNSFQELGLSEWLCESLDGLAIRRPSGVQTACIAAILKGQDVVGSAQTGKGKTAAFALPILQSLSLDPFGIFALVLTPTRELAFQIAEQFKLFGKSISVKVSVIVGGLDMMTQALELSRKPHIVVATPGRLVDHINSSSAAIDLSKIKFLVFDEADRLLESTFAPDLEAILNCVPQKRQTLLFSATMTSKLDKLILLGSQTRKTFVYRENEKYETLDELEQQFLLIPSQVKDAYLNYILEEKFKDQSMIIFTGKCKKCELLTRTLMELGFRVTALHSKMPQKERLSSIAKFKGNIVSILIATDVASRGLDIPQVGLVINYDIPNDPKEYIHRIGRTARAGRQGLALAMTSEMDITLLQTIESKIGKKLTEYVVPEKPVLKLLPKVLAAKRVASMHVLDMNWSRK